MENRMEAGSCCQGHRAWVLLVSGGRMDPPSWVIVLSVSPRQCATQPQRVRLRVPSQVAELMQEASGHMPACKSHWGCRESQPHLLQWSGSGDPLAWDRSSTSHCCLMSKQAWNLLSPPCSPLRKPGIQTASTSACCWG